MPPMFFVVFVSFFERRYKRKDYAHIRPKPTSHGQLRDVKNTKKATKVYGKKIKTKLIAEWSLIPRR